MWSTPRILLIFIASLIACVYSGNGFTSPELSELQQTPNKLEEIKSKCKTFYSSTTKKNCVSFCQYSDGGNIASFENDCTPVIPTTVPAYGQTECRVFQSQFEACIPECSNLPGDCNYKKMNNFSHTFDGGIVMHSFESYIYKKEDFSPPDVVEIKDYRYEICKKQNEERKKTNEHSCFSFCQAKNGTGKIITYGDNSEWKCDPTKEILPIKDAAVCEELQDSLQMCVPECETCKYQMGIPGFKLPPKVSFPVPRQRVTKEKLKMSAKRENEQLPKENEKKSLCQAISSNPTKAGGPCLSFCVYIHSVNETVQIENLAHNYDCNLNDGMGYYDGQYEEDRKMCYHIENTIGECIGECRDMCGQTTTPPTTSPTSTVATTTTTPVQTTTKKDPSPLVSSPKTQDSTGNMPGPMFSIPTYGPEATEEEVATVDPRNKQRATDPSSSAAGDKKEEGGGPNLKLLWILLPVAVIVLIAAGLIAGFLIRRRRRANKSKGRSKTVDVEMGTLPPPPSMQTMQTKKPPSRKRPFCKVSQCDEMAPPREMPPGPITKKFKFEGNLDLDATGTHGKTTHQLDGVKSHSLQDVMFSDQMNRVFDMGSQVENIIPSPPREGVGEGGGQGAQRGQGGQQEGGTRQGGQGAEGAPSQGG